MNKILGLRVSLVLYDVLIFAIADLGMLVFYKGAGSLTTDEMILHSIIAIVILFGVRFIGGIYRQIWRYGGIQCYIRLLLSDMVALFTYLGVDYLMLSDSHISFAKLLALMCINTLCALGIRMVYRYAYKCGGMRNRRGAFLRAMLKIFAGGMVTIEPDPDEGKIKIAIVGAGSLGVNLAEDLSSNPNSPYVPYYFIDNKPEKIGRNTHELEVLQEGESKTIHELREAEIHDVVFAIPNLEVNRKKELYEYYQKAGFKVRVYDYPMMQGANGKRVMRDFDIEELLFRKPVDVVDESTNSYYRNKVLLITGGGGSIGSELCRQVAKMQPKKLIILDVYENGAYDVQQELKIRYGSDLNVQVEILSITNIKALDDVFIRHKPQIVIHAAAHKHVPLMEHNCIEAVENNVFGTLNTVKMCEKHGSERFMMVSTDKAVNPTNVMGATKRMCEMIVQSYSSYGKVKYSATRFGNVLGSAGSVIPLFKRQIASGGPITITDRRIIRYFMTIPEASQLVLKSGAMAKNGELFVLDMGEPVKIVDLAENMIRLTGAQDIEIREIGLRPGEKLYEELLMKSETLTKTANEKIFIEKDSPLSKAEIEEKLEKLNKACNISDDDVRKALYEVVPTYKTPAEVNRMVDC